jgi:hypothetical protein
MNWYRLTLQKIGDTNGLMLVEVKGKDEADAKARLVGVLYLQAVHIVECEEV